MKVLHIVSNLSFRNGVMSVLMSYYRNMDNNNLSFEFLYFDDRDITYQEEIQKLGGKVHKLQRTKNPLKLFSEINNFLKQHITEYNVIHIHEIYLIGALIGIKRKNNKLKIIAHAHATKFSDNRLCDIRNRIMSMPSMVIPDYYCACSIDAGKAFFGKKFKKEGYVINNAIDLSKFKIDDISRKKIRDELKVTDKYVIGHVGNFNPQKNHFFLIDVFNEIQKERDNAVLVLVGDGERREKILHKCQEMGIREKVIYLGTRKDINKVMNSFDCFVLPSVYEGLGIVLIEAQATGLPCVFSDVVPEEANILVKSNVTLSLHDDSKIWAEAVLRCKKENVETPYEEIRKAGYDIKIEAKKLEKYYKDIVN